MLPNMEQTVALRMREWERNQNHFSRADFSNLSHLVPDGVTLWFNDTMRIVKSKIFLIEEITNELLLNTDNSSPATELPFDDIWLEKSIEIGNYTICGIFASKNKQYLVEDDIYLSFNVIETLPDGTQQFLSRMLQVNRSFDDMRNDVHNSQDPDDNITETEYLEHINAIEKDTAGYREELLIYFRNFLTILNHPEIEIVSVKYDDKRVQKNVQRGKLPVSEINHIRLTGKLKEYVDRIHERHAEATHRFWVRGHFMRFRNKDRYKHLYAVHANGTLPGFYLDVDGRTLMRWKLPYLKGEGDIIEKTYVVAKEP